MRFLAIIQARCGSSRLPNKVLMPLGGKPALMQVVDRVKMSKYVNEVVVATSFERNNLPIVKLCAENDVRVFVGSENDVLDRFYQVAKLIKPEYIIRVTADCPVYDSHILDLAIEKLEENTDYLFDKDETLADGLDVEIIKFSALKEAYMNASFESEREHLTQYFRKNPAKFKIINFASPFKNIENKRWTVDEKEDFELINNIYNYFISIKKKKFFTQDILDYLSEKPELEAINSKFARNEGLAKSLNNDKKIIINN